MSVIFVCEINNGALISNQVDPLYQWVVLSFLICSLMINQWMRYSVLVRPQFLRDIDSLMIFLIFILYILLGSVGALIRLAPKVLAHKRHFENLAFIFFVMTLFVLLCIRTHRSWSQLEN